MKVLLYKDSFSSGRGADRAVIALAEALGRRHAVVLVTMSEHATPVGTTVQVVRFSGMAELRHAIAAIRPDVIVSAGTNETRDLASAYPGRFPCPVVHQFHVYPPSAFKWKRFIRNWKTRRAIRRVAAVQVLLPAYVSSVRKWLGNEQRVVVIGNAVDVGTVNPPPRVSRSDTPPHIVYPAVLNKDKRQDLLIRAFARMDAHRNAVLSLYGNGRPKFIMRLKRLATKLGVAKRIRFEGFCDDPASIYANADLVAFPSRVEGFGLVLTEAAAFGKRIVACSDCLASAELVPRFGGILSAPTPHALASALERGLAPNRAENMDALRIENALDEFSPRSIYRRWERLLASLQRD